MKVTLLIMTTFFLSACGISQLKPSFEKSSFYLISPATGAYCRGYSSDENKKHCKSIIPTNFNHIEARVIENIYQQQITEPNRILSLINIIIEGDNIDYTPVLLNNGFYKLPITQQTDTVWDTLIEIEELLQDNDNN